MKKGVKLNNEQALVSTRKDFHWEKIGTASGENDFGFIATWFMPVAHAHLLSNFGFETL